MDNLILSNMLHRPARTLVSILGIAVGVLLIVFTIGMANGTLRERAQRESNVGAEIFFRAGGSVGISGSDSFRLPISLKPQIEKVAGVESAVPIGQTSVAAEDSNTGSRLVDGVNFAEYAKVAGLQIVAGQALSEKDGELIMDSAFLKQKNFKIGDRLKVWERDFTIVGAYEPAAGARIKVPLSVMQKEIGGENKVSAFLVKVKTGIAPETAAENLHDAFPDNQNFTDQRPRSALYAKHSRARRFSRCDYRSRRRHLRARYFADDVYDRHRTKRAKSEL